jgi:hypothetical protein
MNCDSWCPGGFKNLIKVIKEEIPSLKGLRILVGKRI